MKPFRRSIPPQCIAFLLFAAPAFAQTPDSTRAGRPFPLDSIVVTATRVPIAAVTAAATVLTGESLRARGITHVTDALREVPGVSVTRAGSIGGQTTVRIRGGETGYVRVMIDGVALNQPGGDFDFANLTTEDIDRIEVVRGPASVLYGTDAVTGVIQIFTRTGRGPASVSAGIRAGTFGTTSLDSRFAGEAGPAGYSFTLSRYATDGIYAFNNAYRHTVLGGSLQLAADERTDLRVTLHHADDEYHTPTDGSGNVVDRNALQSARRFDLGIDVARAITPRLDARLALVASGSDGGFDDAADGPADTLGFYGYRSIDDVQRRSIDARVDYKAGDGIVLTGGGQVEQKFQHSLDETLSEFGPSTGAFDAERWSRALYAQALVADNGLALNAGARLDDNDAFGTFATFRAGAAYRLPTGTRARIALGNAFREPTFFQNFATGFVIGNPDLSPEHTRTLEAGLEQTLLNDRVALSATWFRQRFRDLIDYSYDPSAPGRPNYFNIALARADGLEVEGHATIGAAWLSASWTHLDTRVIDGGFDAGPTGLFSPGDPLLRRPDDTFTATAGIRIANRARVDATAIRVGERDDIDFNAFARVASAAYTTVDLSAAVDVLARRPGRPWAQLTVRLANAFDGDYQSVRGFASPGRSILAGVRAGF